MTTGASIDAAPAAGPAGRRLPVVLVALAALAALGALVINAVITPLSRPGHLFYVAIDAEVYRAGAETLWSGRPLYDAAVLVVPDIDMMFTYPPFSAIAFLPLLLLPTSATFVLFYAGNALLAAGLIGMSLRLLGYRRNRNFWAFTVLGAVGLLLLEPVRTTFALGQINLLLAVLVVADLGRARRWSGIGVGLAAGIKLTPLVFVVYLLVVRRFRAAAVAVGTFAGTVLLGLAVMPGDAWTYWTDKVLSSGRIGVTDAWSNQSVNGFVSQLLRIADVQRYQDPATGVFAAPGWMWLPPALAVAVAGLWAAARAHRRGQELLAVSLTGMTGCAASPFSWGHHWVWVVPLLLVALDYAVRRGRWWAWAAPLTVAALTFVWWFPDGRGGRQWGLFMIPRPADPDGWHTAAIVVGAGCYPLLLVLTVACVVLGGRGGLSPARPPPAPSAARAGRPPLRDAAPPE